MSNYKVFPIPNQIARRIREVRLEDFGHQLSVSPATKSDNGPCRSCLAVFRPGEGRILFSYAPNQYDHPYNEVGPIYIHEKPCEPYTNHENFPAELRTRSALVLRCYDGSGIMVGGELVGERPVEDVIRDLFGKSNIKYLHARTASVGCYIARIERATSLA